MFGYGLLKYGDYRIPVSDPEKTMIDTVGTRGQMIEQELGVFNSA